MQGKPKMASKRQSKTEEKQKNKIKNQHNRHGQNKIKPETAKTEQQMRSLWRHVTNKRKLKIKKTYNWENHKHL